MDETLQLDRIYTKAVPRKVIFELFEECDFGDFFLSFGLSDFSVMVLSRQNNIDHMCDPRSGLELMPFGQCYCASLVNHYIYSATG